nr:hypothetical protein [Mesorhizobium sp. WSM2561]
MRAGSESLRLAAGGTLREDHRVRTDKIIRKLIGRIGHGAMESYRSSMPTILLIPPSSDARFLRHPPVDAFEQTAELSGGDHHRAVSRRGPNKTPALRTSWPSNMTQVYAAASKWPEA